MAYKQAEYDESHNLVSLWS